jgi:hypothetical protein
LPDLSGSLVMGYLLGDMNPHTHDLGSPEHSSQGQGKANQVWMQSDVRDWHLADQTCPRQSVWPR